MIKYSIKNRNEKTLMINHDFALECQSLIEYNVFLITSLLIIANTIFVTPTTTAISNITGKNGAKNPFSTYTLHQTQRANILSLYHFIFHYDVCVCVIK